MKPKWLLEAEKHIGQKEVKGPSHNPFIVQLWKLIKRGGIKDDETPWCASFLGGCLETVGIPSTRFESAKSYEKYGTALPSPAVGAIATFSRDGGGHVAFVVGQDKNGNILCLGGNQGDKVCIAAFVSSRVTSYRWPPGQPLPLTNLLPILDGASLSRNEA